MDRAQSTAAGNEGGVTRAAATGGDSAALLAVPARTATFCLSLPPVGPLPGVAWVASCAAEPPGAQAGIRTPQRPDTRRTSGTNPLTYGLRAGRHGQVGAARRRPRNP
jgi:hypothetical protein